MPKLTIVVPCYNAERFVGRTIEGVLAQSFSDWELVVVDDGSKDDSARVVEAYLERGQGRIRLLRKANGGVAAARHDGAEQASPAAEYLWFLDADDVPESRAAETFVRYLDAKPQACMAHFGYRMIDENDEPIPTDRFRPMRFVPGGLLPRELSDTVAQTPFVSLFCFAAVIPSVSVLRRRVYAATPGWDLSFGQPCEDTDLFLYMACLGEIHYLPEVLVRYRRHSSQSTTNIAHYDRQKQKLHQKWLRASTLTAEQQARAREAWLFYEGQVQPFLRLLWAGDHFRGRRYGEAVKCCLRSVRMASEYVVRRTFERFGTAPAFP